jgi:hypothetical protein
MFGMLLSNFLSVLASMTSQDLYLRAIQESYPGINTGWLSSSLAFYDNWAQVRAAACYVYNTYTSSKGDKAGRLRRLPDYMVTKYSVASRLQS